MGKWTAALWVAAVATPLLMPPPMTAQEREPLEQAGMPAVAAAEMPTATSPARIAIGWRQFDSIASNFRQAGVNASLDGGRTWEAKGVLGPGLFGSDPVLAAAADGTILYSSLHNAPDFYTTVYRSLDDLASWTPDVYSYGGDKQWIAVDTRQGQGRGHVYQASRTASAPT